jgi:hypothetical protein
MADTADLTGHVALVTGAGRNIGRAIALALAERGADLIVNTRTSMGEVQAVVEEARKRGVRALTLLGDVGRADDVRQLAERALVEFSRVDIVINNAAIRPEKPFLDMSEDDWHRVLEVDLHSAFYTAKAFLPGMVAPGWGRIINLTGMNAIQGYGGRVHVSAAKRPVGADQGPGQGVRPPRGDGQCHFSRPYRARGRRAPPGRAHPGPVGPDSGGPAGPSDRYCSDLRVSGLGRRRVHLGADARRQWRRPDLAGPELTSERSPLVIDYSEYKHLAFERREHGVLLITINRPEVLNATNDRLHWELTQIWLTIDRDPGTRVAVITGAGRAFSAGGDLVMVEANATDPRRLANTIR